MIEQFPLQTYFELYRTYSIAQSDIQHLQLEVQLYRLGDVVELDQEEVIMLLIEVLVMY